MAPKVKEAMGWMSEAFETACGWALVAVSVYCLLFLNLTGNGRLFDALRGAVQENLGLPVTPKTVAVQTRVVPVRPPDMEKKAQDRMLMISEAPEKEISVPVLAAVQPRDADQITDSPSDSASGKDWRVHLTTQLRKFTVYGKGDERSSASAGGAAAPAARSSGASPATRASAPAVVVAAGPTPPVAGSAYTAGASAEARPGIGDHVSRVSDGGDDGVRNFR
jgi:hypothetical protein